jgi:hypothetical protein
MIPALVIAIAIALNLHLQLMISSHITLVKEDKH